MNDASPVQILVIEDDPDTRANLCDILALDDYHVLVAGSRAEALQRDHWDGISAIILDRKLPDGTAEEILPQLKQLAPHTPVIVATGYSDLDGVIAALRLGAADYILKPINPDLLRTSLARTVELYTNIVRDINQRKRFECRLTAQYAVTRALAESTTVAQAVPRLLKSICEGVGWQIGELWQMDLSINRLHKQHLWCSWGFDDQTLAEFARHDSMAPGKGLVGSVWSRNQPAWVANVAEESNFTRAAAAAALDLHGACAFPICSKAGMIGVMAFFSRECLAPDDDLLQLMESLGRQFADFIERKRAEEQLLQNERLAAIGQMVTGLAHESRNALQRSQACLEMLAMEVESQAAALDLVRRIQQAQDHLHYLYEEVRGYAAPINLRRQPCDLAQLWRDTWSHLAVCRKGRTIALHEEIQAANLVCDVDPFHIEQLFRNILENAISACPEPGEIVVRCGDASLDGRSALQVAFHDNGPGIPHAVREKIFEPFYTTKTKGTGLGMAIASRIVVAHEGRIAVGDTAAAGAEILVTLPRGKI